MNKTSYIFWRVVWSFFCILINLIAIPIGIYLLFALKPGTIITNWDIALSILFVIICNIISIQLFIAVRKRTAVHTYCGILLILVQIGACLLYMRLYFIPGCILFAASIVASIILLIKTARQRDPAII